MSPNPAKLLVFPETERTLRPSAPSHEECLAVLRAGRGVEALPFVGDDVTIGSESELQAAVRGHRNDVDLPRTIARSRYLTNLERRIEAGDASPRLVRGLVAYLDENDEQVWENSWVRFPKEELSPEARYLLSGDLRADRRDPRRGRRLDADRFLLHEGDQEWVRVPISYLLNLALVDALDSPTKLPAPVRVLGGGLLQHFQNDNVSPETSSFHVVFETPPGRGVARETARRFLLSHLLAAYANEKLGLRRHGQEAMIFYSPNTPQRQRQLNRHIPDTFYRDLFISPCLSWASGETKQEYMKLCHEALSRGQLQAVVKLLDSGILTNNLALIPRGSDTSLANNGTHISLGSRRLGRLLESGFAVKPAHEKHVGDLAIKVMEHFLPLFVGTMSAAPYRFAFHDFHPERVLGYLPHELVYTHLRMIWRRWKKKAKNSVLGHPVTPFGPEPLDRAVGSFFRLRGDFVADFRLLDYPVAILSTDESPSLDGRLGNQDRLKRDLEEAGLFDRRMSLYLPIKLREHAQSGYSGFEGRFFSQFQSFSDDLAPAADLLTLLAALAFKYAAGLVPGVETVTHQHIPDRPDLESERRQIFFAAAIGLPTFYVRIDTPNLFLRELVSHTEGTRHSHRYRGYVRVPVEAFRKALVQTLQRDAADLIEMLGVEEPVAEVRRRLEDPRRSALGRLTEAILSEAGAKTPFHLPAAEFNAAAERYYRDGLRRAMLREAADGFVAELSELERAAQERGIHLDSLRELLPGGSSAAEIAAQDVPRLMDDSLRPADLRRWIHLFIWSQIVQERSFEPMEATAL